MINFKIIVTEVNFTNIQRAYKTHAENGIVIALN